MKLEYFNVGGSLEDRAAISMIEVVVDYLFLRGVAFVKEFVLGGRAEWTEEGRHCDRTSQRQQRRRNRSRLRRQGIQVILCFPWGYKLVTGKGSRYTLIMSSRNVRKTTGRKL
ncbi:hypothetical protein ANCDUO_01731 [Ancylostoma duodenale]|uniref:Uncharacterized protein n=1 Tax=Ancylostoma duodenale TaxID=51022 RepID=A0A0C2DY73_9BILA|nr:hypothetical protein ANCDUO_01731 [Ancylostoma duodenale]